MRAWKAGVGGEASLIGPIGLVLSVLALGACGSEPVPDHVDGGSSWSPPRRDAGGYERRQVPDGGWFSDDGGFRPERYVSGEEILCDSYHREDFPRCVVGEEKCCEPDDGWWPSQSSPPTCLGLEEPCQANTGGYCDGPEDCVDGMVCCVHVGSYPEAGLTNSCEPPEECFNRLVFSNTCRSDDDCIYDGICCFGGSGLGFQCYSSPPLVGTCDLENFEPKDNPDDWYR